MSEYQACEQDPKCLKLFQCISGCVSNDQTCYGNCFNLYPTGATYDALGQCVLCMACPKDCMASPAQCP